MSKRACYSSVIKPRGWHRRRLPPKGAAGCTLHSLRLVTPMVTPIE